MTLGPELRCSLFESAMFTDAHWTTGSITTNADAVVLFDPSLFALGTIAKNDPKNALPDSQLGSNLGRITLNVV